MQTSEILIALFQSYLYKALWISILFLFLSQVFLSYEIYHPFFNSIYSLENYFITDHSLYNVDITLVIIGENPIEEKILILKNGIPEGYLNKNHKLFINLSEGDVLEVDARECKGAYSVSILPARKKEGQLKIIEKFHKINISGKLYRFPPFSSKITCITE